MTGLEILSIAPTATIQDRGRVGWMRYGVTSGGAMDVYALAEGQALLGNAVDDAALEFAEFGGRFRAIGDVWVAISGAEMRASLNGTAVKWRRSLALQNGDILDIGAATGGVYGYLHVAGGFQTEVVLGARATLRRAGFGHIPEAGQVLLAGGAAKPAGAFDLPRGRYLKQREIRALWGPQSRYFSDRTRADFSKSQLTVTAKRDRMGVQVTASMGLVFSDAGLSIASDAIVLGDIQVTGEGTPTILLADRGSSGGYPRIATIITADIPALAQIPAGEVFTLQMTDRKSAVAALADFRKSVSGLGRRRNRVLRDPREMKDLLSYNLVDGVLRGDEYDSD